MAECYARILVVDDQPMMAQVCAEILAEAGYRVSTACDGQEALACLEKEPFDLLLADLKMPGVDGLAVLRRGRELHPGLTAIMMTSYATLESAIEALRAGAKDFLLKPFDPGDLLRAVNETLAEANQEATLQALREKEELLSSIYDNASDVLFYLAVEPDDRFRFLSVNRVFLQTTGLVEEQVIGKDVREVIPEPAHELVLGKYHEAIRERRTTTWEEISVYPAGKKYGEVSVTPICDAAGHCIHLVGMVHDVTEHRLAQEKIRASEERYRAFFENSIDAILLTSPDGSIQAANPAACQMLERTEAEIIQAGRAGLADTSDPRLSDLLAQRASSGKARGELTMLRRDGAPFAVEISSAVFQDSDGNPRTSMIVRDVTSRKQAEEARRVAEELFSKAFRASPDAMTISRMADGMIIEVNDMWEEALGYSRAESVGTTSIALGIWCDPAIRQQTLQVLQETGSLRNMEVDLRSKTGQVHHVILSGERLEIGGEQCLITIIHDITERERAEEALAAERLLLRTLIDHLPDGVYVKDSACRKTLANPADVRSMGASSEADVLGKTDFDFFPHDLATAFSADDQSVIQSGRSVLNREEMITLPDGTLGWQMTSKVPLLDSASQVVGLVGIGHDITERKRAEVALQEAEARYRSLVEQIPAVIYTDSAEQVDQTLYISPQLKTTIGYDPEEWIADNDLWLKIMHPDDLERVSAENTRANESGGPFRSEYRVIAPGGRIVWIRDEATLKRDPSGRPLFWQGILLDITERKQAEAEYQRAERRYRSLFEDAPVMYVITSNQEGVPVIADCNGLFLSTLGYSRDQVLGRPLADYYAPQSRAELLPGGGYQRALHDSFVVEERQLVTRDGQVIDTLLYASPETDATGCVCGTRAAYVDITPRKRAEEALRASEQRFRGLFDGVPTTCWTFDREGTILDWNRACEELYGWSAEQAIGKTMYQLMVKEGNVARTRDNIAAVFRGQVSQGLEFEDWRADGTVCHVVANQYPVRDASDQIVMGICAQLDITERKQAEEELRRLKEFNEGIVQSMVEGITVEDAERTLTFVNPAAAAMLGYKVEDLVGQPWTLIVPLDQQPIVRAANERRVHGRADYYELELVRCDGTRLPVLVSAASRLAPGDGRFTGTLTVFTDLSEVKRLEKQFRQAQKMEAIGRLAGGVAHDFNNLLTVVHLSTRLLERKLRPEDSLWPHVERIREAGERATNLTKQLLAFSRREIIEPKVLNLNQVVSDLDKMLRRLISEDIELATLLAGDLWSVRIDPTQIEQAVVNLAVNARDAMPAGGKLTIETANVVLDETYTARHLDVEPGEYVLLAASDTGVGMDDEVKAHLFEPFFTTKEEGKGTGLGLATVFGIVKQNQGHIHVYSEPGLGTTFKIYLPRVSESPPVPARPSQPAAARGTETLLVVEDEPLVRELARDILLDQGYQVLTAGDGMDALQVAAQHEGPIHLLVTDVVMPRLSGRGLADQLQSSRPEMRVLYTSGYTDNAIVHHGVLDAGVHFLSKPFELEALARKVRDVLDGSA